MHKKSSAKNLFTPKIVTDYSKIFPPKTVKKICYDKEQDYIDILKNSSFNTKTEKEINDYIEKNLCSLDGIYIDRGEDINE